MPVFQQPESYGLSEFTLPGSEIYSSFFIPDTAFEYENKIQEIPKMTPLRTPRLALQAVVNVPTTYLSPAANQTVI